MTAKQRHNYKGSGRRVRPTTAKISKAQRIILENMRDGGTLIEYFVSHNRPHASLDDPELRRYGRATVPVSTFESLLKRGWIEESYLVLTYSGITHYHYKIADTGRAALQAVSQ